MEWLLFQIERALSRARECLCQGGDAAEAAALLKTCAACLGLYRPPGYEDYNLAALLKEHLAELADETHVFEIDPVADCPGDVRQVIDCLRVFVYSVDLEADSLLHVELLDLEDTPSLALSLDGPGHFPDPVPVGGVIYISREELAQRWTQASHGGRVDKTTNGIILRLKGHRLPPEVTTQLEPVREAVDAALADLAHVERALAAIDGENALPAPSDMDRLISDTTAQWRTRLEDRSIAVEVLPCPGIPPISMWRNWLAAFFGSAFRLAERVPHGGGAIAIMAEYNRVRTGVDLVVTIEGTGFEPPEKAAIEVRCLVASMRRAIVETHEGEFSLAVNSGGATTSVFLPDVIGRRLDEWIPGHEVFSDRSKQVLRLLKSGGQAPPEAILLPAVLEEELERWLLPKLSEAPAINLAHTLPTENKGLPGSSQERYRKALDQIKRGKPRKEITKPPYAAEILYAYRADERHRKALGAERLTPEAIGHLCKNLLQNPPDSVQCLRIVGLARQ